MPDGVSEYAGHAGAHQALEVKVYNPVVSDAAQLLRGATVAFGAARARLMAENLGDAAPPDVLESARPGDLAGEAKYETHVLSTCMPKDRAGYVR